MKIFIKIYLFILILVTLLLLIVHTFSICGFIVDKISIFLLIILILIPFITAIKKFKWGDFEAEIDTKDVEEIEKSVKKATSDTKESSLTPISIEGYNAEEVKALIEYLFELAEVDPTLTMAKLRLELEKLIRGIYLTHGGDKKRIHSIGLMTNYLINKDEFRSDQLESAIKIISVCNRVIHGEKIDKYEAQIIVKYAAKLLGYMTGYSKALDLMGMLKK